jgi:hypothetical protein
MGALSVMFYFLLCCEEMSSYNEKLSSYNDKTSSDVVKRVCLCQPQAPPTQEPKKEKSFSLVSPISLLTNTDSHTWYRFL